MPVILQGVNRTLDDGMRVFQRHFRFILTRLYLPADSSIIYNGIWTTTGCAACLANPSPSQRERLEGGTYHEGVVGPNEGTKGAIFLFSGTHLVSACCSAACLWILTAS